MSPRMFLTPSFVCLPIFLHADSAADIVPSGNCFRGGIFAQATKTLFCVDLQILQKCCDNQSHSIRTCRVDGDDAGVFSPPRTSLRRGESYSQVFIRNKIQIRFGTSKLENCDLQSVIQGYSLARDIPVPGLDMLPIYSLLHVGLGTWTSYVDMILIHPQLDKNISSKRRPKVVLPNNPVFCRP